MRKIRVMTELTIKTLGDVSFNTDRGEFRPPTRKAAALLVYLGLSPRGTRSREHIAGVLWGRSADEQSRASLRQTLSSLRKALDDQASLLLSDGETVGIDRDRLKIDVLEFEALANSVDQADLEAAAELCEGTFLEGFSLKEQGFEEWLSFTRQQYNEIIMGLFVRLAEHYRLLQDYKTALRYAQRLLALDPIREQAHHLLMELFARLGRREQALLQYDDCEQMLQKELQVEPSNETRELYLAIKSGDFQRREANADSSPVSSASSIVALDAINDTQQERKSSDKPIIVVLPFDNLSGDPGQNYFSAGITEDIIIELSRFRSLSVIARSSSISVKEQQIDRLSIASQLSADYLVEGSVRRAGNTVRITAQLIEAISGEHVWANRYDREIEDIFRVQDEVVRMIVSTVGGRLEDHRIRSGDNNSSDWGAYDLILQAQALHYRILKSSNEEAFAILERARKRDPDNARAHSLLGAVLLLDYTMNWARSQTETLNLALAHGRDAVRLDALDSLAHARLGETLIHFGKLKESKRHFVKAIELNPNDSESRALYSLYWVATGDADRALQELDIVRNIDPFERVWTPWFRGEALFLAQRYDEAIESFEEVIEPINDLHLSLSACYSESGDFDTAKSVLCQFLNKARLEMPNYPGLHLTDWSNYVKSAAGYQNEKHHSLLLGALQKIWPEPAELSDQVAEEAPSVIPLAVTATVGKPRCGTAVR